MLLGVLLGLLVSAAIWLTIRSPQGVPVVLIPPPTKLPLLVDVSGAVAHPGVYPLQHGARVKDALSAAGGMTGDADTKRVNLAAFVRDGEKILVPDKHSAPADISIATDGEQVLININTASQSLLEDLPGIGPVTAKSIIQYREEHGPFENIEDICNVPGIGPATFENLKDSITVDG